MRSTAVCTAPTIEFRMPSVGATKNAMLAAVRRRRHDDDPERRDGTRSRRPRELPGRDGREDRGQGTDTIVIDGVDELHGVEYEIIPDRIVTGTLLLAGAITRGDVTVTGCRPEHLRSTARQVRRVRRRDDDRRRLDSRAGRRHHRRHRHSHRAVSGIPDRPAAADGRLSRAPRRARASSKSRSSTRASRT